GVEVELDARAARVIAEELPGPGLDLPAEIVGDPVRLEPGRRRREVARADGDVVDDPAPIDGQLTSGDDVEDRVIAVVVPGVGKAHVGAEPIDEAEDPQVERPGGV